MGMLAAVPPRMIANLRNVDEELAQRVADGLGIPLPKKANAAREPIDMEPSPALSIQKNMKETIETRAIGILIADGSDGAEIKKVADAVTKAGGKAVIVAPKVGGAKLADGSMMKADGQLAGSPSQIFDAVAIILSDEGCKALLYQGAAVQFAMDAFGHLKAIGASAAAKPLLDKAGIEPDEGVTDRGGRDSGRPRRRRSNVRHGPRLSDRARRRVGRCRRHRYPCRCRCRSGWIGRGRGDHGQ
jgi:catalase